MKKPNECNNISDIREAIDSIDKNIINLIAKRSEYVHCAAKFKTDKDSIKADDRVKSMLAKRREWAENDSLHPDFIEDLFKHLINYFTNSEMEKWESINK